MQKVHQMEKGSLRSMGQAVTLHQTKKEERHVGILTSYIIHYLHTNRSTKEDKLA